MFFLSNYYLKNKNQILIYHKWINLKCLSRKVCLPSLNVFSLSLSLSLFSLLQFLFFSIEITFFLHLQENFLKLLLQWVRSDPDRIQKRHWSQRFVPYRDHQYLLAFTSIATPLHVSSTGISFSVYVFFFFLIYLFSCYFLFKIKKKKLKKMRTLD